MGIAKAIVSDRNIPEGKSKSGRPWKVKQSERFSAQGRKGVLSHLCKTEEEKRAKRDCLESMKVLENRMKEETKQKKTEQRELREARKKQRMANEFKSSQYQVVRDYLLVFLWFSYGHQYICLWKYNT